MQAERTQKKGGMVMCATVLVILIFILIILLVLKKILFWLSPLFLRSSTNAFQVNAIHIYSYVGSDRAVPPRWKFRKAAAHLRHKQCDLAISKDGSSARVNSGWASSSLESSTFFAALLSVEMSYSYGSHFLMKSSVDTIHTDLFVLERPGLVLYALYKVVPAPCS